MGEAAATKGKAKAAAKAGKAAAEAKTSQGSQGRGQGEAKSKEAAKTKEAAKAKTATAPKVPKIKASPKKKGAKKKDAQQEASMDASELPPLQGGDLSQKAMDLFMSQFVRWCLVFLLPLIDIQCSCQAKKRTADTDSPGPDYAIMHYPNGAVAVRVKGGGQLFQVLHPHVTVQGIASAPLCSSLIKLCYFTRGVGAWSSQGTNYCYCSTWGGRTQKGQDP